MMPLPFQSAPQSAAQSADPSHARQAIELLQDLRTQAGVSAEKVDAVIKLLDPAAIAPPSTRIDIFHGYIGVFIVAFMVTLIATPIMRRLAVSNGIIDRPSEARKAHKIPIAYMGGVAVFLGLLVSILFSYTAPLHGLLTVHPSKSVPDSVPLSILLGMTVIMIVGLLDDVFKISPRIKIAGQLIAAAALAVQNVGVKLASQLVVPAAKAVGIPITISDGIHTVAFNIPLPIPMAGADHITIDLVYWIGTALIALFVLGACNASNLIDGLDGLLSGTTAISAAGLLIISLELALFDDGASQATGGLDAARIVLCLALLGSCLGFLPHNFNPATIFLGDAGSLLLGYCTIVIILTLGDTGRTNLVVAGLVIYSLPIIDTTLAIVRRKVSGKPMSAPDDQHLHHMLKRSLGVKGAVFTLYLLAATFAAFGVLLAQSRSRTTYALFLVFAAFIGVTAFKIARRRHIEEQAAAFDAKRAAAASSPATTTASATPPAASPEPSPGGPGNGSGRREEPAPELTLSKRG